MVGLDWGTGCSQQLPWVLRKGRRGSCLPKKAALGGMEVEEHPLHALLAMPGIILLLFPSSFSQRGAVGSQQLVSTPHHLQHHILVVSVSRQVPSTFLQRQDPASPAHRDESAVGLGHVPAPFLPTTSSHWSTQRFPGGEGEREDLHFISLSEGDPCVGPQLHILFPPKPAAGCWHSTTRDTG